MTTNTTVERVVKPSTFKQNMRVQIVHFENRDTYYRALGIQVTTWLEDGSFAVRVTPVRSGRLHGKIRKSHYFHDPVARNTFVVRERNIAQDAAHKKFPLRPKPKTDIARNFQNNS